MILIYFKIYKCFILKYINVTNELQLGISKDNSFFKSLFLLKLDSSIDEILSLTY